MELFKEKKDVEAYLKIIHGEYTSMSKARLTRLIVSLHRANLYLNKAEFDFVKKLYNQYQHNNEYSNMNLFTCVDECESILQAFNRYTKNEEYANPNALVHAVKLKRVFTGQYSVPNTEFDIKLEAPNFEMAIRHQMNKNPAIEREDAIGFYKFLSFENTHPFTYEGELCNFDHFINGIASRDPKHAYLVLDYFICEAFPTIGKEIQDVKSIMYKQKIRALIR